MTKSSEPAPLKIQFGNVSYPLRPGTQPPIIHPDLVTECSGNTTTIFVSFGNVTKDGDAPPECTLVGRVRMDIVFAERFATMVLATIRDVRARDAARPKN